MQSIITVFCSFTRGWAVERWVENLRNLPYDKQLINLAFIVDIDDPWIASALEKESKEYRSFKLIINRDWQPNEVRPIERRKRIAEVKNQSKELIKETDGDFVLGFEDDTVFPNLDLNKWLGLMNEATGIIEGVQCGRWHLKMVGVWQADNANDPTEVFTLLPGAGIEEIDAGGFYGYLISKENYLAIPYSYNGEPWGPDVNAGLWLRRQGLKNYVDWDTKFGHNDHNDIIWPDTDLVRSKFIKRGDVWLPVVP